MSAQTTVLKTCSYFKDVTTKRKRKKNGRPLAITVDVLWFTHRPLGYWKIFKMYNNNTKYFPERTRTVTQSSQWIFCGWRDDKAVHRCSLIPCFAPAELECGNNIEYLKENNKTRLWNKTEKAEKKTRKYTYTHRHGSYLQCL